MTRLLTGVDGASVGNFGQGGIIAITSIIMVFVVLLIIILLTETIGNFINKALPKTNDVNSIIDDVSSNFSLDLNDEDATVAALVASIDYRSETKKNIKVVSVRKVD